MSATSFTRERSSTAPTRVAIYGSCVARDSFEQFPVDRWALVTYIARQSLISAHRGATGLTAPESRSPFQRRMIAGDMEGDLAAALERVVDRCDLLLWDLTDERLGVLVAPDGRVVTRSVDALSTGTLERLVDWRLVEFGSAEHAELWDEALRWFVDLLGDLQLAERTVLLQVPWATRAVDGSDVPTSFGLSSDRANELFAGYYRSAGAQGLRLVSPIDDDAVADPHHRWGLAPFHYARTVYEAVLRDLETVRDSMKPKGP
jgi:hypothetical protein